jgi:hypothetical protein
MIHVSHLVALRYGNRRGSGLFFDIVAALKLGVLSTFIVLFLLVPLNVYFQWCWLRWMLLFAGGWPVLIGIPCLLSAVAFMLLRRLDSHPASLGGVE